MIDLLKSVLITIFIFLLQMAIYGTSLRPFITTWGATTEELRMPMKGDSQNLIIDSTRTILINAPQATTWKWLMQLGADRGGFFSYDFIEETMGYQTRHPDMQTPKFKNLEVGDLIRGSINEKSSLIPYHFHVQYVKPDSTLVLSHWGTLLLKKISPLQTRLIIRTQHARSKTIWMHLANYIITPLHYIMERRMLLGIKSRAENLKAVQFTPFKDMIWFFSLVTSAFLICYLIFKKTGITKRILAPLVFSTGWLLTLLLLNPLPLYSVVLLLILIAYIATTSNKHSIHPSTLTVDSHD